MKVVLNKCYGGFGLSREAILWMRERGHEDALQTPIITGEKWSDGSEFTGEHERMYGDSRRLYNTERHDPLLVECVETLGDRANGWAAELVVVDIPDGVRYEISDYDGIETAREIRRSW